MEAVARGDISRSCSTSRRAPARPSSSRSASAPGFGRSATRGALLGPHVSFFYASYAEKLSLEHSVKCIRLIQSRWYQARWAPGSS